MIPNFKTVVEDFRISQFIYLLKQGEGKDRHYYECPNCQKFKLSIQKNGDKYDCYSCEDRSEIARILRTEHNKSTFSSVKKPIRKKQTRNWIYTDANGNDLIRLQRIDDNQTEKKIYQHSLVNGQWKAGLHGVKGSDCTLLYFNEVKKAIANHETIFIVEGETCVDALRKLGFTATTNIGGSGKNTHAYEVLKDYPNLIICPDRDKKGVAHALKIFEILPQSKWLYALPTSPLWEKLEAGGGLDIFDWIEELEKQKLVTKVIKEKIMSSIEDHPRKLNLDNKVIPFKVVKEPSINKQELIDALNGLINENLKPSELTLKFNYLSQLSHIQVREIKTIYEQLLRELDANDGKEIQQGEIEQILSLEKTNLDLKDYLPVEMVNPLNILAKIIGSNSLSQLTAFLPNVASLTHPNTNFTLIEASNFTAKPIFYSAIVGESGSGKSPTMDIFNKPLETLQFKADKQYEQLKKEWREYQPAEGEPDPPEPLPLEYYVEDFTSEKIAQIISEQPNKGFLMRYDELAGLIKQGNAYRGGKGSDQEKLLSGRDGKGWKVNRKNGDRFSNPRSSYSIMGGIQPDILRKQMGNCQDDNGYWSTLR